MTMEAHDDLRGKVAVVTGGASGIGRAIVNTLVERGARVAIIDLNSGATANDETPAQVIRLRADVADEREVTGALRGAEATFGQIDVLINSAGIVARSCTEDTDEPLWDRILDVDLKAIHLTCKAALPAMRRVKGGAIVNIASVAGLHGVMNAAYIVAKGGVIAITRQLASEFANDGIRVNSVSPGFIETPINVDIRSAGADGRWVGRVPLRRYGQPEEVATVCLFLASTRASYMTGANVVIDGGLTCATLPDPTPLPNLPRNAATATTGEMS